MKIVVHTTNLDVVESSNDYGVSDDNLEKIKAVITDVLSAAPEEASFLSFDTDAGWTCMPGRSIFRVDVVE